MCTLSEDFLGMYPSQKKKKQRQVFGSSKIGIPDIKKKKKIMGCLADLKSAVASNCTLSLAFFLVYIS